MLSLIAALQSFISSAQGRPIEFYDIYLGDQDTEDSNTYHYVNFYKNISFFKYIDLLPQTYTALGISRSAVKKTADGSVDTVIFKLCNVNKAFASYAAQFDFRNKRIVCRLAFRDDISSSSSCITIFDGFIQSISFDKNTISASCVPLISSLSFKTGWPYQIQCNAKFGDSYCKINKESIDNKLTGTATGGTTGTLIDSTALTQANDYWNFGTVEFTSGVNDGQTRRVVDFDAATDTITLDYALSTTVAAGDTYEVHRGCDKTLSMCDSIYNNTVNYHGFHSIPLTKS